jgi:arginyl-tRNA synthetase
MGIKQNYVEKIKAMILKTLREMGYTDETVIVEIPPSREMGDLAFPMFKYSSVLKKKPFEIAQAVKQDMEKDPLFEKIEIKGPYLNVYFNKNTVTRDVLPKILEQKGDFGRADRNNEKVVVEFSCPNTNKPLHLGHCRNNVLGDSISRILKFKGYDVVKLNLINDRGIHICKSMLAYKMFGNGTTPEKENKKSDHLVGDYYVKFARELEKNPELEAKAQEMLVLWEKKDKDTIELWQLMNGWAVDGIMATYRRMEISFDQYEYESINYLFGKEIIADGMKRNIFYKNEDGSVWINNEDVGLDKKAVLRSDGTSIYITQDIGTAAKRHEKYGFKRMIYVVASEQIYHFKTLFATLKKLGYEWSDSCYHLAYGMVNLPEGRMKSREGTVVDADNLMDMLTEMAAAEIDEKQRGLTDAEKKDISNKVSLAALRYYLLNFSALKDVTFIPENSISFDGNTGPYLQYTTARINSLLKKAGGFDDKRILEDGYELNSDEWEVVSHLIDFEEVIDRACSQLEPVEICSYLYELSRLYNKFYHFNPIMAAENAVSKDIRLSISNAVLIILSTGLELLGIHSLEKM